MLEYYEQRQPEYEAIYAKPERQEDLAWLDTRLANRVAGERVLEIACGTGYWTRRLCRTAVSVHATDASARLAASAVASCHECGNVTSGALDAYDISYSQDYDCLVAGFFYSHVAIEDRHRFLAGISQALTPGSRVVLFDNRYVEGSSSPISRREVTGDTFQTRYLADGSSHDVLKNFPSPDQLSASFDAFFKNVVIEQSQYFWIASGVLSRESSV